MLIFFLVLLTVSVEFGRAVWLRFYPPAFPPCPNPSFVAHLGGVLVGLTLGVVVLQNYEQKLQEQSLFWIFFCVYTLFVLCAVFWNIFAYSLLDVRLPPPPWLIWGGKDVSPWFLHWQNAWPAGWLKESPYLSYSELHHGVIRAVKQPPFS